MYNPDSFRVDDPEQMQALVREHPLATLVMQGVDGPDATHVPLLLMPDDGQLDAAWPCRPGQPGMAPCR